LLPIPWGEIMKYIILLVAVLNLNNAMAMVFDSPTKQMCESQANYVMGLCSKYTDQALKNCLITEMEVQDFFVKKNFVVDSDLTVVCLFTESDFNY